MDLEPYRTFAPKNAEHALLFIPGQRTGFAVPVADFQVIDPGRYLRIFAGTTNTRCVPALHTPGIDPLLRRTTIFIHSIRPFFRSRVRLSDKSTRLAVGTRLT